MNYTSDPGTLVAAINSLTLNASRESNMVEGILEIVEGSSRTNPSVPRSRIVAIGGGSTASDPRSILAKLGDSGATMHAATLRGGTVSAPLGAMADENSRDQVLGDGPSSRAGIST